MSNVRKIDLAHLLKDFSEFRPDNQFSSMDGKPFVRAMAEPEPEFVIPFIKEKMDKGSGRDNAIRDLYAFLLDRRYYEHLNLLYFAFDVFCSNISLPKEVLDLTPLPHEDGVPLFKYSLVPGYKIK